MKVHYDIEQGTLEWHEMRWGKIGGTRGGGLLVESDTLLDEVLSELTEDYQDDGSFQSKDMMRGHELEPIARYHVNEYLGQDLLECGWIDSSIHRVGISPDGITKDETIQAEIKCFAIKKHTTTVRAGVIPPEHIRQCLHYFLVNPKLERLIFCSFRPEHKYQPVFIRELTRSSMVDVGIKEKVDIEEDRGLGLKSYVNTIPKVRSVEYWVDQVMIAALKLNKELDAELEKMKF